MTSLKPGFIPSISILKSFLLLELGNVVRSIIASDQKMLLGVSVEGVDQQRILTFNREVFLTFASSETKQ